MCWLFAASSASSAIVTTHSLLSAHTFILLLTSLSFSVHFGLSCLLTLSDRVLWIFLLISSLWSTRFHDSLLIHGFFLFRGLPRTLSTTSVHAFSITWKPRSISSSSSTNSPSSSSYLVSVPQGYGKCLQDVFIFQLGRIVLNSNSFLFFVWFHNPNLTVVHTR